MTNARYLTCAVAVATLLAGCAKPLPSGESVETEEITARVTAIDRAGRLVTVQGEEGNQLVVQAGEGVRNFDQIEVGDTVAVTYTEAIAWEVKKGTEGAVGVSRKRGRHEGRPGRQARRDGRANGHGHCGHHGDRHAEGHRDLARTERSRSDGQGTRSGEPEEGERG